MLPLMLGGSSKYANEHGLGQGSPEREPSIFRSPHWMEIFWQFDGRGQVLGMWGGVLWYR